MTQTYRETDTYILFNKKNRGMEFVSSRYLTLPSTALLLSLALATGEGIE